MNNKKKYNGGFTQFIAGTLPTKPTIAYIIISFLISTVIISAIGIFMILCFTWLKAIAAVAAAQT